MDKTNEELEMRLVQIDNLIDGSVEISDRAADRLVNEANQIYAELQRRKEKIS